MDENSFLSHSSEYLDWLQSKNLTDHHLKSRALDLQEFFIWCNEKTLTAIQQISRPILERYQRSLFNQGGFGSNPAAKRRKLVSLKNFFRWLCKSGALPYNPAYELEIPPPMTIPRACLSNKEIQEILKIPDLKTPWGFRDRAILEVLRSTGLRRSECVRLGVFDYLKDKEALLVRGHGGRGERIVPMDKQADRIISHYLSEFRSQLLTGIPETKLFLTRAGNCFSEQGLSRLISEILKQAGLFKTGSCRLFRNTTLKNLLARGIHEKVIREFLGIEEIHSRFTETGLEKLKEVHDKGRAAKKIDETPEKKPSRKPSITLKEALVLFLKEKGVRTAPRTFQFYENNLRSFKEWFGEVSLEELDRETVNHYIEKRKKQGIFENTISREIQDFNSLLKFSHQGGYLQELKRFPTLPKEENRNPITIIDREDFERVLQTIKYPYARLCLMFLRYMGLRKSEATHMRHTWINPKTGFLHVHSDAAFKTKTKRGRILKIPGPLLEKYLSLPKKSDFVHPSSKNPTKPITDMRKTLVTACKKAKVKIFNLKDLRHSFNTTLAEKGVSSKIRAVLLGHSTTAITDNVYTHARDSVLEEVMAGIMDDQKG